MTSTRIAAFAVAAVLALGLAACGGDDDGDGSSATTATALTKDEFLKQANAICAAGNDDVDSAAQDTFSGGPPTDEQTEQFVTDTVIPAVQGQIDDIRALGIPTDDQDEVNGILDDAESDLDTLKADPAGALNKNTFADTNKELSDYGLTVCAN